MLELVFLQEGPLEVGTVSSSRLFAFVGDFKRGRLNVENGDLPGNAIAFGLVFPMVIREGPLLQGKGPVVLSAVAFALADD